MCWGAQRNQCPRDLETGCRTRSLLQLHCCDDHVGTQRPFNMWDPTETCWQGLLDDLHWRQISAYWNRLSDSWWRVYFDVCLQAALLAQIKTKTVLQFFFLSLRLFLDFCFIFWDLIRTGQDYSMNNVIRRKRISKCRDLISLYSLYFIHCDSEKLVVFFLHRMQTNYIGAALIYYECKRRKSMPKSKFHIP